MARDINIRFSVKDGETVKRALAALGADGEAALKRLENAGKPASRGLAAVDSAVKELKGSTEQLASQTGRFEGIFRAFGTAGLLGAAALGGIVLGMKAVYDRAQLAADKLDELQDAADRIGVGTEFLQGLRFAVGQAGGDIEKTEQALDKLNTIIGNVARGGATEAERVFKRLGVSVRDSHGEIKSVERLLPEIADGFRNVSSAQERASIATALFGRGNVAFARVLAEGGDALAQQIQLAREMGAVIDADLVKKGAEAKDKLEALAMVIDAQINQAMIDALPAIVDVANAFASAAKWAGNLADSWKSLDEQRLQTLRETVGGLREEIEGLEQALARADAKKDEGIFSSLIYGDPAEIEKTLAERRARLAEYEAAIEGRSYRSLELSRGNALTGPGDEEVREFSERAQEVIDKLEIQEEQARKTARELAIYNALLAAPDATADERDAITRQAIATFEAQEARRKSEEAARKRQQDAQKAERDAERNRQQIQREGERVTQQVATAEEQRAATIAKLSELLRQGAIDNETYNRAVAAANDKALGQRTDFGAGIQRGLKELQKDTADFASVAQDMVVGAFDSMEDKFVEFVRTGKISFADLIDSMIADLARLAYRSAMSGLLNFAAGAIGNAFGGGGAPVGSGESIAIGGLYAKGGVFDRGRVKKFAAGGVVDRATLFNIGMMGEAGPEAIMPLVKGPGGRLGVSAHGGGAPMAFSFPTAIDARGANITEAQIQALLEQNNRRLLAQLPALIKEARQRAQL